MMKYIHTDSNSKKDSYLTRLLVAIILPLIGLSALALLWIYNPTSESKGVIGIFCPFNKLTHLYCPVCGMTRAAYEFTKFNFIDAIRNNALIIFIVGPSLAYLAFMEYVNYVLNQKLLPKPNLKKWMIVSLIIIVLVFTVLRNIPVFPFTYLAPIPQK